jgi:hypothetical protein
MRLIFEDLPVDVIGVNKTYLTASICSKAAEIKGYTFVSNGRTVEDPMLKVAWSTKLLPNRIFGY